MFLSMLLHWLNMPSSRLWTPNKDRPQLPTPCRWMFLGLAVVCPATLALAAGLPGELRGMSSNIVKLLDFGSQHPIYVPSKASVSWHWALRAVCYFTFGELQGMDSVLVKLLHRWGGKHPFCVPSQQPTPLLPVCISLSTSPNFRHAGQAASLLSLLASISAVSVSLHAYHRQHPCVVLPKHALRCIHPVHASHPLTGAGGRSGPGQQKSKVGCMLRVNLLFGSWS